MRLVTAILPKPVNWIIGPEFPLLVPLTCSGGWSLVNPLVQQPVQLMGSISPLGSDESLCFFSSNVLSFSVPQQDEQIEASVELILRRIRYLSGQARLPAEVAAYSYREVEVLPSPLVAEKVKNLALELVPYVRSTAVTFAVVDRLSSEPIGTEVPIFATCLLDAIEAFDHRDFKKAILLSAIGIETVAKACVDGPIQDLLASSATPRELRIVEPSASGGNSARKDPIYEALRDRGKRNFILYLHELPLYVLRRSLLVEDQNLYLRAKKLREERNDIAHAWTHESAGPPGSRERAACALDCARQVFAWFCVGGNYALPDAAESIVAKRQR